MSTPLAALLVSTSLMAGGTVAAQVPDSILQALNYFPLQVGNRWQYRYGSPDLSYVETRTVTGEATMANGRRYAVVKSMNSIGGASTDYLRPDSSDGVIYRYDPFYAGQFGFPDGEIPRFMPVTSAGSREVEAGLLRLACSGIGTTELLGVSVSTNWCNWTHGYWHEFHYLGDGIGPYSILTSVEGEAWAHDLVWYDVNGQTAGTYVGIERDLPESDEVATVYPNPAEDHVTLRIPSGAPGPVNTSLYDRIGRRVLSLQVDRPTLESELVLDVSRLPPGVYLGRFGAVPRPRRVVVPFRQALKPVAVGILQTYQSSLCSRSGRHFAAGPVVTLQRPADQIRM